MPKYLVKASYGPDGIKGLLKDGGTSEPIDVSPVSLSTVVALPVVGVSLVTGSAANVGQRVLAVGTGIRAGGDPGRCSGAVLLAFSTPRGVASPCTDSIITPRPTPREKTQ